MTKTEELAAFKAEILGEVEVAMRAMAEAMAKEMFDGELGALFDRMLALEVRCAMKDVHIKETRDALTVGQIASVAQERIRASVLRQMASSEPIQKLLGGPDRKAEP